MNYIKSCLIIIMFSGMAYNQCNESNWEDYYPEMQECHLVGADLSGAYLEGANLQGAQLEGANLEGAFLIMANLYWANLSYANLSGAYLGSAYLYQADLYQADLSGVSCWATFFVEANLDGTIFDEADLTYAYFDEDVDGYDDVSYEAGAESGDLNLDGVDNIQDVVILVNNILNP